MFIIPKIVLHRVGKFTNKFVMSLLAIAESGSFTDNNEAGTPSVKSVN